MKHPKYEKMSVPRIHRDVKEMNGQSTKRLAECIDKLSDLLDKNDEVQNEEVTDESDPLCDTE